MFEMVYCGAVAAVKCKEIEHATGVPTTQEKFNELLKEQFEALVADEKAQRGEQSLTE